MTEADVKEIKMLLRQLLRQLLLRQLLLRQLLRLDQIAARLRPGL